MCGRYAIHANPEVVALQFALDEAPEFKPSYNVCPGTDVLVVRTDREARRVAREHRWGLIPHWAKDPAIGNKLANARGESLAERPARQQARERRPLAYRRGRRRAGPARIALILYIIPVHGTFDRAPSRDPAPRARADRGIGLSADARRDRAEDGLSLGKRCRAAPARAGEERRHRDFFRRFARHPGARRT